MEGELCLGGVCYSSWPSGGGTTYWNQSGTSLYPSDNNWNVGIGTTSPEFKLTLDNDGGIIAKGTYGSGATLTTSGAGTRLIWYPRKAAFRVGYVSGTQWDDANIGDYSSLYSTAMGIFTTASGHYSTAMGYNTTASGYSSTAIGMEIEANGDYSVAIALNDQNGTIVSKDNTMAIMGGNVGIGTTSPSEKLEVNGSAKIDGDLNVTGNIYYEGSLVNYDLVFANNFTITEAQDENALYFLNQKGEKIAKLDENGNLFVKGKITENFDFGE
ncbi:MAG: hypothetical protein B6U88_01085 [Candidatus Aenigmarchaeota archaeon ex4484_56]|nr:MAG: hypothetical protein B6U88_01085 [Candidatus Aenigmarchaeota archaeon ex4484_56]